MQTAQSTIDLQQLALFLATQQQFLQPQSLNHHSGPVSVAVSGQLFGMVCGQSFSTVISVSPFGPFGSAPGDLGRYDNVSGLDIFTIFCFCKNN